MIILGLTGSAGMGKTTTAAMLRGPNIRIFDADACVRNLLARNGEAFHAVASAFPDCVQAGTLSRPRLATRLYNDPVAKQCLEDIIHPLVQAERERQTNRAACLGVRLMVWDIPLLFEGGHERKCDWITVVHAPRFLQYQRLLRRPEMTVARIASIRMTQMSSQEKCRRADSVILTGLGKHATYRQISALKRFLLS